MINLLLLLFGFNYNANAGLSNSCTNLLQSRLGLEQLVCSKKLNMNPENQKEFYETSLASLEDLGDLIYQSFSALSKRFYYTAKFSKNKTSCSLFTSEFSKKISDCLERSGQGEFASMLLGDLGGESLLDNLKKRVLMELNPLSERDNMSCINPSLFNNFQNRAKYRDLNFSLIKSINYVLKHNADSTIRNEKILFIYSKYPFLQSEGVISYLIKNNVKNTNSSEESIISEIFNNNAVNHEFLNKCKKTTEIFSKLFCKKFNFANVPLEDKPVKSKDDFDSLYEDSSSNMPINSTEIFNRPFFQCQTEKCNGKEPCELDGGYDYNTLKNIVNEYIKDEMQTDELLSKNFTQNNCSLLYCENNIDLLKNKNRDIKNQKACIQSKPANINKAKRKIDNFCNTASSKNEICEGLRGDNSNLSQMLEYINSQEVEASVLAIESKIKSSSKKTKDKFSISSLMRDDSHKSRLVEYSYKGKKYSKRIKTSDKLFEIFELSKKKKSKTGVFSGISPSKRAAKSTTGQSDHDSSFSKDRLNKNLNDTPHDLTRSQKLPAAALKVPTTQDSVEQPKYIPAVVTDNRDKAVSVASSRKQGQKNSAAKLKSLVGSSKFSKGFKKNKTVSFEPSQVNQIKVKAISDENQANFQKPITTGQIQDKESISDYAERREIDSRIKRESEAISSYNKYQANGSTNTDTKSGLAKGQLASSGDSYNTTKGRKITIRGKGTSGSIARGLTSASNPLDLKNSDQIFEISKEEELTTVSISQIEEFTRVQVDKPFYLKLGSGSSAVLIEVKPASCGYKPKIKKTSKYYSYLLNNPSFSKCLK